MATKKKTWKDRVGSALKKTELMINPIKQAQFTANVGKNLGKKVLSNKRVQNVVKNVKKGASDVGKTVKKTTQNVNPQSEINKKINKKKQEIKDAGKGGSGKARAQLLALKRKKSGKKISEIKAENERKMRENAAKRHAAWKEKRKNKKNTKSAKKIGGRGGFTG